MFNSPNVKLTESRWVSVLRMSVQKKLCVCLCIFYLGLLVGCGDSDRVVIDFSKVQPIPPPSNRVPGNPPLRVAVSAMTSPRETFDIYRRLLEYLSDELGTNLEFVQRKTYAEVNVLLEKGYIDLAFICSGPYATGQIEYGFKLVAVPVVQGRPFYRSYLLVNRDSPFQKLEDLRGRTFAFTDPDSHTGRMVPTYWLARMNETPETFFGQVIYTFSHDNSILAIERNLIDGAAIDGLIWEYFKRKNPDLVASTRIIKMSEPFGIPPLVASKHMDPGLIETVRRMLFSMHLDPEGQSILSDLMIDRFIMAEDKWYDSIRKIYKVLTKLNYEKSKAKQSEN